MIGHSQVYKSANPPFTHLTYWGCYLWPGCSPVVPDAAEVCSSVAQNMWLGFMYYLLFSRLHRHRICAVDMQSPYSGLLYRVLAV